MNDLARRVRSHARACRMMGVDFLPARRNAVAMPDLAPMAESVDAGAKISNDRSRSDRSGVAVSSVLTSESRVLQPRAPAAESFLPTSGLFAGEPPAESLGSEVEFKPLERLPVEQSRTWLERLRERYERDAPHSKFVTDHHSIVFGEGDPAARLMFVGEAPGAEEDKVGRPFVGRAGQLLDKMITAMGLERKAVYITNVLKTRPPNNATPTFDEAAACAPYLFEQIAIVRPEVIVTLGLPATRLLLHSTDSMARLRGRWARFTIPRALPHTDTLPQAVPASIPVMPTYHPAFLLRSYTTENRQRVWSDLLLVLERLGLPKPIKQPVG